MRSAVIIDAVRTPIGRRNGALRDWHPVDLAAEVLMSLQARTGIDPALIDDVILGCVSQVGEQAVNVARSAVLGAGWVDSVPGTTVDRQCGSSQQAVHFAAQGVLAGAYDIVVAGGVEVMSRVPMGSAYAESRFGLPYGPKVQARYARLGGLAPEGIAAEAVAQRWGLSRDELDRFSLVSHERARHAADGGRFDSQVASVTGAGGRILRRDEGIRDTTLHALAALKPTFVQADRPGVITAGNSSQISDGAAALLIMSEGRANELGLTARARFVDFAISGADPLLMLTAPIPATHRVLGRAGLTIDQIDAFEVHEAFAAAVLAWVHELHPDMTRVNANGGAIALGDPLGSSGARLMTTLLCELERAGGRFGLQTMCEGGGMANATIIERL